MGTVDPHSAGLKTSTGYRMAILAICATVAGIWYFGSRTAPSAVAWVDDHQDALRQAEASGRLVLLDFGADQSVNVTASNTSSIDTLVGGAAAAVSGGMVAVSGAVGVAIGRNLIGNETNAFIENSDVIASGDIRIEASASETIEADVFAGPITLKSVHKPYSLPQFFQWVWGEPKPVKEARKFEEPSVSVGKLNFEVVDLSGHCEEMFGFWEPEKGWFFSSDAVPLPSRKQMAMPEENIPKMISRMKEIRDLDVKVLFDGHRGPIPNPREHIETRINFLSQLQTRVLSMAETGKTIPEIKTELGFPEPWYLPNTEGRFEIEHLIRSLLEDSV